MPDQDTHIENDNAWQDCSKRKHGKPNTSHNEPCMCHPGRRVGNTGSRGLKDVLGSLTVVLKDILYKLQLHSITLKYIK